MPKTDIFLSYSREDASLAYPIAQVLRIARKSHVFFDKTSIKPGDKWLEKISKSICQCHTFVLVWSYNSNNSRIVKIEYELAIKNDKRISPILLDDTPLPIEIKEYHFVDFREFREHFKFVSGDLYVFVEVYIKKTNSVSLFYESKSISSNTINDYLDICYPRLVLNQVN